MKLTSSFQLLAQQYLGNTGYGNVYIRTYGRVSSQGYDIVNNRTLVYIEARIYTEGGYWYSSSGTTYSISFSGSNSSGAISCNGQFNAGETVLGTLSGYVTHNNDGSRTIHAECNFTSSPWGWNATASATNVELPQIKRYPELISGENFTDETNPTLTFKNYGAFPVRVKLEAGGNNKLIIRDISQTATSYKFELTEEERITLRKLATTNSLTVTQTVCAMNGETELSSSYKNYTMTIVNANPDFNDFEFADINPQTVRLLEGEDATISQSIILGYSNVKVTIPVANKAIAQKEATMNLYRFNNIEEKYSDIEDVSIISNNVPSGEFKVYAIDSRNNAKEKIKSASRVVNYTPLLKKQDLVAKRENGVSEKVEISFSGVVDLVNFGAITNSIKLAQYRHKVASSNEWSEYSELELTIDETGNFSFNSLIKGPTESLGFDINDAYNIEVYIEDELSQITYTANLGSGVPHIAYAKNGVSIMGKYDESVGGLLQVGGKKLNIPNVYNTYSDSQTDTYSCDYVNKKGTFIKVTNSEEQTITTNTTYTIKFDTEYINTSDCLSLDDNKIVIGKGVSSVLVNGRWTTGGGYTFQKYIYLYKNGVQYAYKMEGYAQTLETSTVIDVKEGDTIEMEAYHERGSDARVTMSPTQTHLQVTVL